MGMRTFDRMIGLSPSAAMQSNPHYEIYQIGLKWAAVGILAVTGGLTGDSFHMELGRDIAAGGGVVLWLGGGVVASEVPNLADH
jgi:uncharacterized protein YcfJ